MCELTAFQKKCEGKLVKRLEVLGLQISDRKIMKMQEPWRGGKWEPYIDGSVKSIRIFIYEDEAGIARGKDEYMLEALDFDTEDDLILAFCNKVMGLLHNVDDDEDDGSSKSIVLFTVKANVKDLDEK